MNKRRARLLANIAVLFFVPVALAGSALADQPERPPRPERPAPPERPSRDVCNDPRAFLAKCHAKVVTNADDVTPLATQNPWPSALTPADLRSAYKLPSTGGAGQTIAIVIAYDNPNIEGDLAAYRSQFGLPPCTTANGCFRKVNQSGQQGNYPTPDVGWGQESALDLDMASAICPSCKLLLVEANTNLVSDLALAVDRAYLLGATAISNSYGAREFQGETNYEGRFNHPGVMITASSGDSGYVVEFPAASRYVTAVGGTRLYRTSNARGWDETAWNGAGSGCSKYVSKPAWQTDGGCNMRTVADVAAVADPSTGVAVYSSYGSSGGANWYIFGGTSVSAPIVAGIYALAGNGANLAYGSRAYSQTSSLFDVLFGSNGSCAGSYLCNATAGYDGPTGLGTPNGLVAFGGAAGNSTTTTSSTTPSTSTSSSTTTTSPTTTTTLPPTTTSSTTTSSTTTTLPPTTTSSTTTSTTVTGAPPSAPQYVTARQSASPGVLVYWYPPSSYGCGPLTGYRIYRSTTSGAETFLVGVSGSTYQYQDSATTPGVRYYYKVTALNACGEGPRSTEVTAIAR